MTDTFKDAKKYDLLTKKTQELSTVSEKDEKELKTWDILKDKP
jgi:hypothetical protein